MVEITWGSMGIAVVTMEVSTTPFMTEVIQDTTSMTVMIHIEFAMIVMLMLPLMTVERWQQKTFGRNPW